MRRMKKTLIFGHKKPDTDSVMSAIGLSYFKNMLGEKTEPRILGTINKESAYALNYFGVKAPKYLNDVKLQIRDVNYHKGFFLKDTASIYDAYQAICDILDAIYFGKLRDKTYKTSKGEIISVPFGHGINYYNQDNSVFEEMVADYSEIIKSEKSVESIHYLRYVVGDELVDLLARFYEERVLHIEPTLSSKEVKSHGR